MTIKSLWGLHVNTARGEDRTRLRNGLKKTVRQVLHAIFMRTAMFHYWGLCCCELTSIISLYKVSKRVGSPPFEYNHDAHPSFRIMWTIICGQLYIASISLCTYIIAMQVYTKFRALAHPRQACNQCGDSTRWSHCHCLARVRSTHPFQCMPTELWCPPAST